MLFRSDKYATRVDNALISKGTLENVLAAKLGDIETALDELHSYAMALIGGAE